MRDLTPAEQLVDEVLAKQRAKGRAKYGAGLDAHDGHDWPMEALQELTDATQYLAAENVRLRAELDRLKPESVCVRCGDDKASVGDLCRDCDLDSLRADRAERSEPPPTFYGPKEFIPHPLVHLDWAHEGWWASVGSVSRWFPSAPDALAWLREETAGVEAALVDALPDGLAHNIADLRALSDGWLDGAGLAPDRETLDWLRKTLPRWTAAGMPMPRLYPTEDGFVRAEWPVGADGIDASAEFHACVVRSVVKGAPDA